MCRPDVHSARDINGAGKTRSAVSSAVSSRSEVVYCD